MFIMWLILTVAVIKMVIDIEKFLDSVKDI